MLDDWKDIPPEDYHELLREAEQFAGSRLWALLVGEMHRKQGPHVNMLYTADSPTEMHRAQGVVKGLRCATLVLDEFIKHARSMTRVR